MGRQLDLVHDPEAAPARNGLGTVHHVALAIGTEAEQLPDHLPQEVVDARVARLSELVEELTSQRAEERCGEVVEVLIESVGGGPNGMTAEGRTAGQAPDVDGSTTLRGPDLRVGDLVTARVVGSAGVDLVATLLPDAPGALGLLALMGLRPRQFMRRG